MAKRAAATKNAGWQSLYAIGGWAALLQLSTLLALIVVWVALGAKPAGVEEYFLLQQESRLAALLRGDFLLLFLIGGYLGVFPALYMALRHINPVAVLFATLFTFYAVMVCFATESSFALLYLGDQYAAAAGEAARSRLLAAGEAVIAADMWHSSGAYISGVLLQGAGVIVSLVMLRSRDFSKVTAISGLLGNAIDLGQHLIHPFTPPAVSALLQNIMGSFYLVWFPMLARDLFRLAKVSLKEKQQYITRGKSRQLMP